MHRDARVRSRCPLHRGSSYLREIAMPAVLWFAVMAGERMAACPGGFPVKRRKEIRMISSITAMDVRVLVFFRDHLRFSWMTPIMQGISAFGFFGWFILTILLLVFRKTRDAGKVAAVSLAIEAIVVNLMMKLIFARIRPFDAFNFLMPIGKLPTDYSFPSGHTANSFAVALSAVHMLPRKEGIPLVILATLVAYSRMYLGVHYPSDVIGGFLVALVISQAVWYFMVKRPVRMESKVTESE